MAPKITGPSASRLIQILKRSASVSEAATRAGLSRMTLYRRTLGNEALRLAYEACGRGRGRPRNGETNHSPEGRKET